MFLLYVANYEYKKEANWYDKIVKENVEAVTMALDEKVLGIQVAYSEKLQTDLQRTIERKPEELEGKLKN